MLYYYSRVSFTPQIEKENKKGQISIGLYTKATVTENRFKYKFFDVEFFEIETGQFLVGSLVKYDPDGVDETADEKGEVLKKVSVPDKIIGKARFVLHIDTSLLAFHEVGNIISAATFYRVFQNLFNQNQGGTQGALGVKLTIEPVPEEYSFVNRVKEFTEIKRVVINLVPSNPNSGIWKDVDDDIKARGNTHYREIQENKKKGGTIVVTDETEKKFRMSEDGYGDSTVIGNINGVPETITTKKTNQQTRTNVTSSDLTNKRLIDWLLDTFISISKRANNK